MPDRLRRALVCAATRRGLCDNAYRWRRLRLQFGAELGLTAPRLGGAGLRFGGGHQLAAGKVSFALDGEAHSFGLGGHGARHLGDGGGSIPCLRIEVVIGNFDCLTDLQTRKRSAQRCGLGNTVIALRNVRG